MSEPYSEIPNAVYFVETFLDEIIGDMIEQGYSPDMAVTGCRKLAEVPADSDKIDTRRVLARAEMENPQFLTYIAGKLGAV